MGIGSNCKPGYLLRVLCSISIRALRGLWGLSGGPTGTRKGPEGLQMTPAGLIRAPRAPDRKSGPRQVWSPGRMTCAGQLVDGTIVPAFSYDDDAQVPSGAAAGSRAEVVGLGGVETT